MLTLAMSPFALGQDHQVLSEEKIAEQAKVVWESGAINPALDILEHGIQENPSAFALHKLRGDILATSRGPEEAIEAYDRVLARTPNALDVRWAKWGVLVRSGQDEEAVEQLRQIAQSDGQNPLIHLRLAQELRKLDRLEESLEAYQKAVALVPNLLSWRLALARARFDLLDYQGAEREVRYVLERVAPGSSLEPPAETLLSLIQGTSQERGRRHDLVLSPKEISSARQREWALIRADAWRLYVDGRYQEAEPIYRKLLALNPNDPSATHQLALSLVQLGRCKEALTLFGTLLSQDQGDDDYADTVYRMGQCMVELERWEDAFVHFQTLYDAAVAFEENNKGVELPPGSRVLDKGKISRWLDKVRPHVPELAKLKANEAVAGIPDDKTGPAVLSEEELYAKAIEQLKPQKPLDARVSLAGRDADFSWFRFVIPAGKVMRDDFPTGAHEFIPLYPGDTFPSAQEEIYLVFGLVSASYDAVPLTARCFLELSEMTGEQRAAAQDQVMMAMNDQSGYFKLSSPAAGWTPGLYRCGLFAGERTSADTQVEEVRFRIQPVRVS
jgi:tetratricopeptide (TPR) repeat protein